MTIRTCKTVLLLSVAVMLVAGCASNTRPVLYPNEKMKQAGNERAQRDVDDCMQLARDAGVSETNNQAMKRGAQGAAVGAATGAVGAAVGGGRVIERAAQGAAVGGTAGAVSGAFNSDNPVFRNFVGRCLRERGYDVIGWQ